MPADPRGGWFRVYSRQVVQHEKFRGLSHAELGAWLDLRAAVDLLGGMPMADRTEALLRLRRRTRNPSKLLDRLIGVRLLDVLPDGGIAIHDLDEHDRRTASDDPARIRERVARYRKKDGNGVTSETVTALHRNDVTKPPRARAEQSRAETDTEAEAEPDADAAARLLGVNGSSDPLTIICGLVMSAKPIEDAEYRTKVDAQTRRFGKEWVTAAYRQAYADMVAENRRPRQWDLSRIAEVHLAEWTRAEELRQVEAQHQREEAEREARRAASVELSDDDRERQSLIRRAVGIWVRGGRKGTVPEKVDELRAWIADNEQQGAPA